jgi:hypothetical protein
VIGGIDNVIVVGKAFDDDAVGVVSCVDRSCGKGSIEIENGVDVSTCGSVCIDKSSIGGLGLVKVLGNMNGTSGVDTVVAGWTIES